MHHLIGGKRNVKFHDTVYTTPFGGTHMNSFLMVYLYDNVNLYDCI